RLRKADFAPGITCEGGFAGAERAHSAGHRTRWADSFRLGNSADSVALEYANAHSGAGRIRAGDRRAGGHSGGGVQPSWIMARPRRSEAENSPNFFAVRAPAVFSQSAQCRNQYRIYAALSLFGTQASQASP